MAKHEDIVSEYFQTQNEVSSPMSTEQIDYMNDRRQQNGFDIHPRTNSGQKIFYYMVEDDENIEIKSVWESNIVQLVQQLKRDNYTYIGESRSMPRWKHSPPEEKQ